MILDRYFARRFMQSLMIIGSVFLTLILLIDMIEQLRRFEEYDVSPNILPRLTSYSSANADNESAKPAPIAASRPRRLFLFMLI